jgi:enoyl-CoA hydratase/3-hydroxyacyl-CoA dehydrogenase
LELGLVDAVVPATELLSVARQWALEIAHFQKPRIASLHRTDRLEPLSEAREILKFAREQTKQRAPNLRHPLVCLDVVEEGIVSGGFVGLIKVYSHDLK